LSYGPTLDEQLRKYAHLDGHKGGIYVRRVSRDGPATLAGIQSDDVILEIDGFPIDSRGDYEHPRYGKLNFRHLVRRCGTGRAEGAGEDSPQGSRS